MKLGDLKQLLKDHGLRPLAGRSQNFLLDDSVVQKIVKAASLEKGALVLEIGPGPGILTEVLLSSGAQVLAVEIDSRFCRMLRERFGENPNFKLVEGDVLEMSNQELVELFGVGEFHEWKVVANLPYAITSSVLEKFLFQEPRPESMTLMLQREVVDRILATPKKMSSLAVVCQTLAKSKKVVNVPRDSFFPAPKVDSSVIHMRVKNSKERQDFFGDILEKDLFKIVSKAFSQKRKQLGNSLKGFPGFKEPPEKYLNQAKISRSSRPEELTPEQWIRLAQIVVKDRQK